MGDTRSLDHGSYRSNRYLGFGEDMIVVYFGPSRCDGLGLGSHRLSRLFRVSDLVFPA